MTILIIIIILLLFTFLGGGNWLYCKLSKRARIKKRQGYHGFLFSERPMINRDFDRWLRDEAKETNQSPQELLSKMIKDKRLKRVGED